MRFAGVLVLACLVCGVASAQAQEKTDPASQTDVMQETLRTIREVERLNEYIKQNEALKSENTSLKQQLAALGQQVQKLTNEIQTQNERLKKQFLTLPPFEVKAKLIGPDSARAVLDMGGKVVRIRENVEMSVPVENGVWTLIRVEKISKDIIQLNFLELDRVVTIYD